MIIAGYLHRHVLISKAPGRGLRTPLALPRTYTPSATGSPGSQPQAPVEDFFSTSPPVPYDLWAQHALRTDRVLKELDAMQRQMDRDFEGAWARAEQLAQRAVQQRGQGEILVCGGEGWRSYSRQRSMEGSGTGGYRREFYLESVTVLGPPPPMPAAHLGPHADWLSSLALGLAAFLAGAWAAATRAFNRCYHLTSYSEARRWQLLLLWPVLLLLSPAFRQQFWAAMRGQGGGQGSEAAAAH